jgi:hypothetical protein
MFNENELRLNQSRFSEIKRKQNKKFSLMLNVQITDFVSVVHRHKIRPLRNAGH